MGKVNLQAWAFARSRRPFRIQRFWTFSFSAEPITMSAPGTSAECRAARTNAAFEPKADSGAPVRPESVLGFTAEHDSIQSVARPGSKIEQRRRPLKRTQHELHLHPFFLFRLYRRGTVPAAGGVAWAGRRPRRRSGGDAPGPRDRTRDAAERSPTRRRPRPC